MPKSTDKKFSNKACSLAIGPGKGKPRYTKNPLENNISALARHHREKHGPSPIHDSKSQMESLNIISHKPLMKPLNTEH